MLQKIGFRFQILGMRKLLAVPLGRFSQHPEQQLRLRKRDLALPHHLLQTGAQLDHFLGPGVHAALRLLKLQIRLLV